MRNAVSTHLLEKLISALFDSLPQGATVSGKFVAGSVKLSRIQEGGRIHANTHTETSIALQPRQR